MLWCSHHFLCSNHFIWPFMDSYVPSVTVIYLHLWEGFENWLPWLQNVWWEKTSPTWAGSCCRWQSLETLPDSDQPLTFQDLSALWHLGTGSTRWKKLPKKRSFFRLTSLTRRLPWIWSRELWSARKVWRDPLELQENAANHAGWCSRKKWKTTSFEYSGNTLQ